MLYVINDDQNGDPYDEENELQYRWVCKCDWEYKTRFQWKNKDQKLAPTSGEASESASEAEATVVLDCEGIDTVSNLFVNGQFVGSTDNMFRRYRFRIGEFLKQGENELRGIYPFLSNYH